EGGAFDAHERPPGVAPLFPHLVGVRDRVVRVGEERERKPELLLELGVGVLAVGADAEDDCACALELAPGVADVAGLARTPRRDTLRVKVKYAWPPSEGGQGDPLPGVRKECEVRCWPPFCDWQAFPPPSSGRRRPGVGGGRP